MTASDLLTKKRQHQKITMLTAYDYPTAVLEDRAGIDAILVGDSLGTNVLGYPDETHVTMADMLHHLRAVLRGVEHAYVIADMPYGSHETPEQALANAQRFLDAGASGVKMEGWGEKREVIRLLSEEGVEVCGHIGYNPQIHGSKPKVFGRSAAEAADLVESAWDLAGAGIVMLVLEKIPAEASQVISARLAVPTIGIGSGADCDGQVLVVNDILGITPFSLRHARKYADYSQSTLEAVRCFKHEVECGLFPTSANGSHMADQQAAQFAAWLERRDRDKS